MTAEPGPVNTISALLHFERDKIGATRTDNRIGSVGMERHLPSPFAIFEKSVMTRTCQAAGPLEDGVVRQLLPRALGTQRHSFAHAIILTPEIVTGIGHDVTAALLYHERSLVDLGIRELRVGFPGLIRTDTEVHRFRFDSRQILSHLGHPHFVAVVETYEIEVVFPVRRAKQRAVDAAFLEKTSATVG